VFEHSSQHVASHYAGTFPATIPLPPNLEGRQDCEALIIGARLAAPLDAAGKAW
jgi:gamma-glutamylputrescine oxidase